MECNNCKDIELKGANDKGTVYIKCNVCGRALNKTFDKKQRTIQQNKRLHQWMTELATEFNNRGLYVQKVLKPTWEIEWTPEMVKDNIVRPIAEAVAKTEHTSELTTVELVKVIDVIDKNLLQKFQVNLPFSEEEV